MRKINGILFDYDGTLVDSARKNMQVCIEVLKHFDPQIEETSAVRPYILR